MIGNPGDERKKTCKDLKLYFKNVGSISSQQPLRPCRTREHGKCVSNKKGVSMHIINTTIVLRKNAISNLSSILISENTFNIHVEKLYV